MIRGSSSNDGAREARSDRRGDGACAGQWPWPTLVAFRFVSVWFLVEFHSALVQLVPLLEPVAIELDRAKRPFYVWIARTVCGIRIESFSEISGDSDSACRLPAQFAPRPYRWTTRPARRHAAATASTR